MTNNIWKQGWIHAWGWTAIKSNIANFFHNIKYSFQRIARGYCDRDVWNLCDYIEVLLAQSLRSLAADLHSYPGDYTEEGKTYENWVAYLNDLADRLSNTADPESADYNLDSWEREVFNMLSNKITLGLNDDVISILDTRLTDEEKQDLSSLEQKIIMLNHKRMADRNQVLLEVLNRFEDLWD